MTDTCSPTTLALSLLQETLPSIVHPPVISASSAVLLRSFQIPGLHSRKTPATGPQQETVPLHSFLFRAKVSRIWPQRPPSPDTQEILQIYFPVKQVPRLRSGVTLTRTTSIQLAQWSRFSLCFICIRVSMKMRIWSKPKSSKLHLFFISWEPQSN